VRPATLHPSCSVQAFHGILSKFTANLHFDGWLELRNLFISTDVKPF
jgi:hypothetical protein